MPGSAIVLMVVGGILLIAGAIAAAILYEKKRTAKMKELSEQLGLSFFEKGDPALIPELSAFQLFSQGRSKRVSNMLHGESNEVEAGIFDYQYTTGSGKNSTTWRQTVVYLRSAALHVPPFVLRPESVFHRIGQVFGYQDIDFESHPVFSKRYLLRSLHEEAVRRLFTHELLTFFEAARGASVEASGEQLIYYRAAKRAAPEKLQELLEEAFAVYGLLKRAPGSPVEGA